MGDVMISLEAIFGRMAQMVQAATPPDNIPKIYTDILLKVSALEGQVGTLSNSFAMLSDYGKVVGSLLLVVATVIVYFAGKSFSDLRKDTIDIVSAKATAAVEEKYRDYAETIKSIEQINAEAQRRKDEYEQLDKNIKSMLIGFSVAEHIGDDFGGLLSTYQTELQRRAMATRAYRAGGQVPIEKTSLEPKWRATVKTMLTRLAETPPNGSVDPNTYFNAATLASSLDFDSLAFTLVRHAATADPCLSHVMRKLRMIHATGGSEAEAAYEKMLAHVEDLTLENPHIVLSEAWNAAERSRTHGRLVGAIDRRIAKGDTPHHIPSYAFVIKAQAMLRQGDPAGSKVAIEVLAEAERRLREESPQATWYESSLRGGREVAKVLADYKAGKAVSFTGGDEESSEGAQEMMAELRRMLFRENNFQHADATASGETAAQESPLV